MKQLERVFKAVGNKRRLAIIKYLKSHREASVGDIAAAIKLSFRATSKHLIILNAADMLEREQRNIQMFYHLVDSRDPIIRTIINLV